MQNVSVFVLTATSRSASPLTNFTFQAIVPKVTFFFSKSFLLLKSFFVFLILGKSSKATVAVW